MWLHAVDLPVVSPQYGPGDEGDQLFFIECGTVSVRVSNGGKEREITTLSHGDYFGEAGPHPRPFEIGLGGRGREMERCGCCFFGEGTHSYKLILGVLLAQSIPMKNVVFDGSQDVWF